MSKDPLPNPSVEISTSDQLIQEVTALRSRLAELSRENSLLRSKYLPESEARYEFLFNNMTEAFALHEIITDSDGKPLDYRFLEINPAFQQMTGLTRESAIGKTVREVIPDIESYWIETYGRVALEGAPVRFDHYAAGLNRWYEVFAYRLKPRHFAVIFTDITERKQMEDELRQSEARYREIASRIPGMVYQFVLHQDGSFSVPFVSDRIYEYSGYKPAQIMAEPTLLFKPIHPDDVDFIQTQISRSAESLNEFSIEHRLIAPNGNTMWFNVRSLPQRLKNGDILWNGISIDITQRKQAEDELSKSKRFANATIDALSANICVLDEKGAIITVNKAWLDFAKANPPMATNYAEGANYLAVCDTATGPDSEEAKAFAAGLRGVISREREAFSLEYPCHSPEKQRWFIGRVTRFSEESSIRIVVAHSDITERKKAEINLWKREEKFRNLFNNAQVGMFVTRLDGSQMLDMNDRFLEIFGRTREEMIGAPSSIYWADPLQRQEMVRRLEAEGRIKNFECGMLTKRGETRQCLASLKLYREQGILEGALIDITERKQHESERTITLSLLKSLHKENDLKALIKDITILMQNWSGCEAVGIRFKQGLDYPYFETRGFPSEFVEAESRLCAVDPKGEPIRDSLGNPVLECMCGNVIRGRVDPDLPFFTKYGSFWTNSTTDLLATTTDVDRQTRTRNRCHGQGYESVALVPLSAGNQKLGLIQFNDTRKDQFDEHKIALFERLASSLAIGLSQRITALALKESEAKYRSMMEAMEDPAYICSADFHIEYMNPAMIQWIGRDATGEVCHKVLHGIEEKCPQCIHDKVMKGEHVTAETDFARDEKTYQVSNTPIVHANGSISKLSIFRDVSEIKDIEKRIQQSQKLEAIGALAGGIAHDFNNLLFPISGMAEMLIEDLPADSVMHENANEILKAAKRAGELVRQILSFSRQAEQQKAPLRIQLILKEVLKLIRATIPSDIEITHNLQNNCGLVMANPTQIHQVAMNLITNAFHAVEQTGGKISVNLSEHKVTVGDLRKLQIEPGSYALMSVSDTGHGIPSSIIDKIFDPYFTTKENGKGTGLGLSTVYGILREHGGQIRVTSEAGKGATFDVYLPLMEKANEVAKPEVEHIHVAGTERILLVDDEEQIIRLEKQMLERLGYQVEERTSSIEALKAFRANPNAFDLVISDMTMPNMTGDHLAKELMLIRPDIPVIICTGFSERINIERAKMIGVKDLLMKPIVRSEMAQKVRKVLDGSKGNIQQ